MMKDIIKRTITGSVYVLAVISAIVFNPIILAIFFGIIALFALYEFYKNSKRVNIYSQITGYLLAISTYLCFPLSICFIDIKYLIIICILLTFLTFIIELYRNKENPFNNIAYTILGIIYVIVPMGLTNYVVNPTMSENTFYPLLLLGIFILAWCNDTFAYLVGVKFGKKRLFERHSPKKSWEGFIGGVIAVQIASLIIYKFSSTNLLFFDWMIMGLIISIVGTFGDLVESMFKRQVGVKDSGNILPGHGGILDRFDIIFIAIPFIFSYLFLRLN